jgi:hypothetical protein
VVLVEQCARAVDVAVTVDEIADAQDPIHPRLAERPEGDVQTLVLRVHVTDQAEPHSLDRA